MAYALSGKVGVDFTKVSTASVEDATVYQPDHRPGSIEAASDGNTYIYVKADGAIDQYDAVLLKENSTDVVEAVALTTALSGSVPTPVGFAQVAIADNQHGWVVLKGNNFTVNVAATCAADIRIYTSATAGHVDDSSGSGDLISGARLNAATTSGPTTSTASALNGAFTNHDTP